MSQPKLIGAMLLSLSAAALASAACSDDDDTSPAGTDAGASSSSSSTSSSSSSSSGDPSVPAGPPDATFVDVVDVGSPCDQFCDRAIATCTGKNQQYASRDACIAACVLWPFGLDGDTSGNSVACRRYHVGVAAQSAENATTHCPHTSVSGGGVCQ